MLVGQNNGASVMNATKLVTQGRHAVLNGRRSKRKVFTVEQ